jgi:hypothetical protein
MVHAPLKTVGLNIPDLYTMQEITRRLDMVSHTARNTTTGSLYRTLVELLIVEAGMGTNIFNLNYKQLSKMRTESLVKSSWKFLHDARIQLHHDISIPLPRTGDQPLMPLFQEKVESIEDLSALNRCCLFLHAYHISDLTDGSGKVITNDAWTGICFQHKHRAESWPQQANPTRNDWNIWKKYVKLCFLHRGMRLRSPLGKWHDSKYCWVWFFSPTEEGLYYVKDTLKLQHGRIPVRTTRLQFFSTGEPCDTIPQLYPATVYKKGNNLVLSGYGEIDVPHNTVPQNLAKFLEASPGNTWCTQRIDIPQDAGHSLVYAIKNNAAIAVSDGSFRQGFGTAAFVLEGYDQDQQLKGRVISPGCKEDHSAYRSELTGILATLTITNLLCT